MRHQRCRQLLVSTLALPTHITLPPANSIIVHMAGLMNSKLSRRMRVRRLQREPSCDKYLAKKRIFIAVAFMSFLVLALYDA